MRGTRHPVQWGARVRDHLWKVLIAALFLLPMAATLQIKHVAEGSVAAERDLMGVVAQMQYQDALLWRVISGWAYPAAIAPPMSRSRVEARRLVAQAMPHDPDHAPAELVAAQQAYDDAVDRQLTLLSTGRTQEALAGGKTDVDLAFDHAIGVLRREQEELAAAARRDHLISDAGMVFTVISSLGVMAGLQGSRRRTEVRHEAERRSEARYRALIHQSTDLFLVTDREGRVRFLSPSAERALAPADVRQPDAAPTVSEDPFALLAALTEDDRSHLAAALHSAGPEVTGRLELSLAGPNGLRQYEVSVADLSADADVGGLVVTAHDVTEQRELLGELEHRALHDALTGLPNRSLLADRLEQELRSARRSGSPLGLLLIDLDRFKEVNDTFGHHYGDSLLAQVGPRLRSVLREVDTVARLGGDEFAVLLPGVKELRNARFVAEKLLAALVTPFFVENVELDVEASIGAVVSGEHGDDAAELLQRADIAMYAAKTGKLGVCTYDPATDVHSPDRHSLRGDLRRAIDRNELVLHFQPKMTIETGEVVGAEALVRWNHPERGPRQVADLLAAHGVPARRLELEVTESAIMTEPLRAKALLEELAALGVKLSIDDFGAGYTSLGQLKDLPITELKIDKSFVLTMTEDPRNAHIVRSVVDLGHSLGLALVAEGVETAEALEVLREYGCDVVQGYFICKPVAVDAFDRWRATRTVPQPAPTHD